MTSPPSVDAPSEVRDTDAMRTKAIRLVFGVTLALASGGCGGSSETAPNASHPSPSKTETSASRVGRSPEERRLHHRLTGVTTPLGEPPFGTGFAVAGVHGATESGLSLGTLWGGGPSVDAESAFNVASVSKVLTAARVVSLAHAKEIGLDDPIAKHLPGVKLLDRDGRDQASMITIRHLLQHRSGLPHVPRDIEAKVADRWSSPELLRLLTDAWELPLEGTPGQFAYSNTGYALLGAIVERTRRCSFADCMATYLAELGMKHATFWPGVAENFAHGRVTTPNGVEFNPPGWYASRYALPYTGLWISMPDLARVGALVVAASKDPRAPLHALAAPDGPPLGMFRNSRIGAPTLEHDGSGPGFHAALVVVPEKNAVLALATNGGSESKEEGARFGRIVRAAVDALPPR